VIVFSSPRFRALLACLSLCAAPLGAADGWTGLPEGRSDAAGEQTATPNEPSGSYRPVYGLLWLQIDPDGVAISLDGDFLDKDVWLVSIPPGNHVLRVSKPGFQSRESHFAISAGQNVRLDVKLLPDTGG
jgi:hypothetical protein